MPVLTPRVYRCWRFAVWPCLFASFVVVVLLCAPPPASAMEGSVEFSGDLLGAGGVPVPGASIKLTAPSLSYTTTTGEHGEFASTLGPGPYKLEVEGNGLDTTAVPQVFYLRRAPSTIAGNLTENLQLPFHQLTVKTVDANGVVPDVKVGGGGFPGISHKTTPPANSPRVSPRKKWTRRAPSPPTPKGRPRSRSPDSLLRHSNRDATRRNRPTVDRILRQ